MLEVTHYKKLAIINTDHTSALHAVNITLKQYINILNLIARNVKVLIIRLIYDCKGGYSLEDLVQFD